MIRKVLLGLLFFVIFSQVNAAGFPKPKFNASFSKSNAKAGDIIEIIIKFDVAPGFHVYSEKSDCPADDGPIRSTIEFKPQSNYQLIGTYKGVGDHMVKENDIWHCSTGEFTGKGEFRQKIKVLSSIASGIDIIYNGQICNESGCDMIRDVAIKTPTLTVEGKTNMEPELLVNTAPNTDTTKETSTNPSIESNSDEIILDNSKALYRKENGKGQPQLKTFNGQASKESEEGYLGLFLLALISGLTALFTPCVFPMIPMTVSFFIKNQNKAIARRDAILFSLSIIAIYTFLGTMVAMIFGASAANWMSTHWLPNIFFTVIFIVFAASFFGMFEITMPSWLVNKVDKQVDKGGLMGPIFMALTIALVSFSCTGPIVGAVLVEAVHGGATRPIVAMFGFSLAFAVPFGLLALFPSWLNNLPKSGGWLNSVKVVLGFIELAFALKFLSMPDQTYHWGILDREIYLAIWIAIFSLLGLYLLGKIKFSHDSEMQHMSVFRLGLVIAVFSFVIYMIPGMWGAPLKGLAGYLPPLSSQDFKSNGGSSKHELSESELVLTPKYTEYLHLPHGLSGYFDYDQAFAVAKKLNKPVFVDFTGHACVNCRKMEESVWSDPRVLKILNEKYVVVSLYVDEKKVVLPKEEQFIGNSSGKLITGLGEKNAEIQEVYFEHSTQPLYCLMDPNENLLQPAYGAEKFNFTPEPFVKFLEDGINQFKNVKK